MRQLGFDEVAVERLVTRNLRFGFALNALRESAADYSA
jgi:hypothetical protein